MGFVAGCLALVGMPDFVGEIGFVAFGDRVPDFGVDTLAVDFVARIAGLDFAGTAVLDFADTAEVDFVGTVVDSAVEVGFADTAEVADTVAVDFADTVEVDFVGTVVDSAVEVGFAGTAEVVADTAEAAAADTVGVVSDTVEVVVDTAEVVADIVELDFEEGIVGLDIVGIDFAEGNLEFAVGNKQAKDFLLVVHGTAKLTWEEEVAHLQIQDPFA